MAKTENQNQIPQPGTIITNNGSKGEVPIKPPKKN
jgi:hypothetical protein